jgi:hypothetical protein
MEYREPSEQTALHFHIAAVPEDGEIARFFALEKVSGYFEEVGPRCGVRENVATE